MTDTTNLRELPAKWLQESEGFSDGDAMARRACARELQAALSARDEASAPGGEVTEWRDAFIHVSAMRYIDNGMMHGPAYKAAEEDARVIESANRAFFGPQTKR